MQKVSMIEASLNYVLWAFVGIKPVLVPGQSVIVAGALSLMYLSACPLWRELEREAA
jgi:hypothetical protein